MSGAKKLRRYFFKTLLFIGIFLIAYFAVMFSLSRITVNSEDEDRASDVAIYIKSNGVHTDIVFPIKTTYKDWTPLVHPTRTLSKDSTFQYVGLGWGDHDFYLNTPEWSDLKASTAFKAAFWMGTGLMHATFHKEVKESELCIKVMVSKQEYLRMVAFAESSFIKKDGQTVQIPNASYGDHDLFFEAHGKYNLFYTCNAWANNCLKSGGQKAALWSLTDTGILCHYR
ncbi:TIGR02117 family protein [Flavobacterium sp. MAH-1]|uniref:TIGR02117 family protein n=1 Tax=Flavobacterium agri TaxID=2743471 RepID=A0A7Y9C3R4_9FLAO|nr:TIGR02117 family protein [Flavobacterium agri]NUY79352.1 TIGR02117 family protein [Flavobacterium agri]NYA69376.1 TIGR02117 family protein [Flavobacterium agri]